MRDTYINSNMNHLKKFSSSSRSTEFKVILPWNVITKTVPISTRIVISDTMKRCRASRCELVGKSMETVTTTSEFPNGGKAIVEHILASEEINKSKRAELI